MAKKSENAPILLRWSSHVRASDVQDPLGLGLRRSARLASLLLYCITSITPRARYFSFVPWCIFDYQQREKGKPHALGLEEAMVLRERAFALACVAHHEGEACDGGALVGSDKAQQLLAKGTKDVDFKSAEVRFAKIPARKIYFNSLANLGVFLTDEEMSDLEEDIEQSQRTFEDIQLSSPTTQPGGAERPEVGPRSAPSRRQVCPWSACRERRNSGRHNQQPKQRPATGTKRTSGVRKTSPSYLQTFPRTGDRTWPDITASRPTP